MYFSGKTVFSCNSDGSFALLTKKAKKSLAYRKHYKRKIEDAILTWKRVFLEVFQDFCHK